jgi:hypothetical protein
MACFIIGEYIGGGYSQNVGQGLKLSPHIMPLFLECPHLPALYATSRERERKKPGK